MNSVECPRAAFVASADLAHAQGASPVTREQHLERPDDEIFARAKARLRSPVLGVRQQMHENRCSHNHYDGKFPNTCAGYAVHSCRCGTRQLQNIPDGRIFSSLPIQTRHVRALW